MATAERTLSQFVDAWNAGERPFVHDYLDRVDARERDELAGLIQAFLEWAPSPSYSDKQRREIASEPAVKATLGLVEGPGVWSALLPKLRRRARITRQQVVKQLTDALDVRGREARVEVYYHQMETGTLDPGGVSQRVLDALAGIFGVSSDEIAAAGDFSPLRVASEGLYYRADELLASPGEVQDSLMMPASGPPDGELDEVDRLFRGGR